MYTNSCIIILNLVGLGLLFNGTLIVQSWGKFLIDLISKRCFPYFLSQEKIEIQIKVVPMTNAIDKPSLYLTILKKIQF